MSRLLAAQRALTVPGWVKEDLSRKAQAIPSLDLRFAENKSLADVTTGANLVTFTRASSGTYVGSNGVLQTATNDAPRFDHNPTTGESLGLLVEEQRTNLLLQSEDFATTWTVSNTTVSTNQITAPDGFTTADRIVETATTAEHNVRQDTTSQPASTYTASIFAKAGERDVLQFVTTGVLGGQRANFDLTNGVVGSVDVQITARIIPYPGGWYRCVATATSTVSGTLRAQWNIVTSATAARTQAYAGDITKGLYLWGAMIEAGSFPTSYIPTTTATATRSADVASITGTSFSSFYSNTGSTALGYAQSIGASTGAENVLGFGAALDGAQIRETSSQMIGMFRGTYGTDANSSLLPAGLRKMVIAYAPASTSVFAMNGIVYTGGTSSATLTNPNAMGIGSNGEINNPWNGTISRITYWPTRLANSTLQQITQ